MKEVVLRIEDSAFEKIIDFLQLCPVVDVVSVSKLVETKDLLDKCFHEAVSELRKDKVFRRKGEYGYIMLAINDNVIKGFFFYSPTEYLDYLKELEFERQRKGQSLRVLNKFKTSYLYEKSESSKDEHQNPM